jgi:nitrogen-specific signal transduction histidine kinase
MVLMLDRVMQFHLDRTERESIEDLEGALEGIKGAWQGVDVGFIDEAVLQEWQEIVIDRAGRNLPWQKFSGMVKRLRPGASAEETEDVMDKIPEMLEKVRAHIPDGEIAAFRESAMRNFVEAANRYLKAGQAN